MNPLIGHFKNCCFTAGQALRCSNGQLIRGFGLNDFLENEIDEEDGCVEIAIAAIDFFCSDSSPNEVEFRFAVIAVCDFLHRHHAKLTGSFDKQSAIDLVAL